MEHAHHPARIPDRLFKPHRVLGITTKCVLSALRILRLAVFFVAGGDGEDEQQRECRARDKAEKIRIGKGVDVHEREVVCEPELVD